MNALSDIALKKPEIPEEMQTRWQQIVDLMARILDVPAGLIVRANLLQMEVFLSSETPGNPFPKGILLPLNRSLYCEKVIKERASLLVHDALKDTAWEKSPAIERGITYYLGYPVLWPDKEAFGTICVMDRKENAHASQYQELLSQFRSLLEKDLTALIENNARENLLLELQRHRDYLQGIIAERTAELENNQKKLEVRLKFEHLISDLSANLVTMALDQVDDAVTQTLDQISRFFGGVDCELMEVLPESGQIRFVSMTDKAERLKKGLSVDLISGHPWTHNQLIGQGDPVIFSSLDELPTEAGADRDAFEREGTKALFIQPLQVGGKVTHLICLRSQRNGHQWPTSYIPHLGILGQVIANVLIHKRSQEALQKSEHFLSEAQRIAGLGSWEWDLRNGIHYWDEGFRRLFGFPPQKSGLGYEAFLASIHPDDRKTVRQAHTECMSNLDKIYSIEYRVVLPDGVERVIHSHGEVSFDQHRNPVHIFGTVYDITERKQAEEALSKAFNEIKGLKEQLEAENIYLRETIETIGGYKNIIGISNPIKYVMYRIQKVATTNATVLLTGETGTGKGVFARALHESSNRKNKSFIHVNCAGLPANLIESELFGREKGAFTGATARQMGRFELANGGTIFLDEIGELPIDLQSKLLKVIEDGEFERLGSPHSVKVDVRIIASTNRLLEEEMKKGQFRRDLFYRLNVFPITIPSLRQRKEDIPLLVKYYTDKFSKHYLKDITIISKSTMKAFTDYSWPGNVRELINVIERAVIVSDGPELQLAEQIETQPDASSQEKTSQEIEMQERKDLVDVERKHIMKVLQEAGWKIEGPKGAAKLLSLNPSTLRARIKKLGIKRP
jgi:formate hydrogenlyase transcriptional activator